MYLRAWQPGPPVTESFSHSPALLSAKPLFLASITSCCYKGYGMHKVFSIRMNLLEEKKQKR